MILAIESSCDDSSLALYDENKLELIYHKKISQELEHNKYGGVVPELAARLHTQALPALLESVSEYFFKINAVAVVNEPGLSVSLLPGVSMAKSISIALNIPLIAVNHLIGHVYSLFLNSKIKLPLGVLLVSGGHTMILDIENDGKVNLVASTGDDSFGESFDKVAKMLSLGYPGGLAVQNMALKSKKKDRFDFTVPLMHSPRIEYSFSGLKNQVRLCIEDIKNKNQVVKQDDIYDICYAFENAACAHIVNKLEKVFLLKKWKNFGVVGGASANLNLRNRIEKICQNMNCNLILAPLDFCSDNAAMIARASVGKLLNGEFTDINELEIRPKSIIDGIYV